MTSLLLSCRRCGGEIDPGPRAQIARRNLLLDCACTHCGQRALYEMHLGTVAWS